MKRLLMVLVVLGALVAPSRAVAQQIPVGPGSDLSSLVGLPIDVPFVVDMSARPERLGSFALRIQWDTTKLHMTLGMDGSFGSTQVNADSLAFGVVRIAGVSPTGAAGRVTLAVARLTPLVRDTTTLRLSLSELYAAGTFADLLPNAVVTNGAYCPARGRWGDIDGDGNANSRDALIALSNAVGLDVSAFDISLGDVDGSATTNARDALIILSNAVGMDVRPFRVLQLAGGACVSRAARALTIVPGGLELVVGQTVRFEARAGDSSGVLQAIADVTWQSGRPSVLGVAPDGSGVARDTGTAVVTVRRGTTDSAQTAVHVVARRTTHWVDAQAARATNRLGTPALPFGMLNEDVRFAQAGDTVRVRLGVYDLNQDGSGSLDVNNPMVIVGDTAADGSRPTIAGNSGEDAVVLQSPGSVEIHNFDISGYSTAFVVMGPSCALFRGVRVSGAEYGVRVRAPAGCVRVERSRLTGLGPQQGEGWYYSGNGVKAEAVVDTLTIEDTEVSEFGYGVSDEGKWVDSLTIRRSLLHDLGYSAVYLSDPCYYGCVTPASGASRPARVTPPRAGAPPLPQRGPQDGGAPPTSQAVVIEASRLARSNDNLVYLVTTLRRAVLTHSTFTSPGTESVVLSVSSSGGGYLSLIGDSIVAPPDKQHWRWLYGTDLDSLVLDAVQVVGFQYGDVHNTPLVRVSNSTFRDVRSHALEVTASGAGAVVRFDNVGIYGDPRDDLGASGLVTGYYGGGVRMTVDRLTAVNLYEGVNTQGNDSSTIVTNSLFQHVEYPVHWDPYNSVAPDSSGLTVRNTTFRGFSLAVEAYNGTLVADSNTFVNGYEAIVGSGPRPMTLTRNRISGTELGIELASFDSSTVLTVADNVIADVTAKGVVVDGAYYQDLQTVFDVRRNAVTCVGTGTTSGIGIELQNAHVIALDNQVDGCYAGLHTAQNGSSMRNDSIVGNTVSVPASGAMGIGVSGNMSAHITRNTVTGAATGQQAGGLINAVYCSVFGCAGYGPNIPTAIIDSNIVTGGTVWGIRAENIDSLDIRANRVENLNLASTSYYQPYYEVWGAVVVLKTMQNFARIAGNVIRHIRGNGIVIDHSSELATLTVDSNVVADIDSSGLSVRPSYPYGYGQVSITRNLFTSARREGLLIGGYSSVSATDNNIAGNVYGLRLAPASDLSLTATNNWWGDALGPSCIECPGNGDSSNVWVGAAYRTAPNDSVPLPPAPAPRFMAQTRAAPLGRAVVSTSRLDAPITGGERLHGPRTRPSQPTVPASLRPASPSRPGAETGPLAERHAAEERDQAALEARRAARLQQLRERAEERARAARASVTPPQAPRSQGVRP